MGGKTAAAKPVKLSIKWSVREKLPASFKLKTSSGIDTLRPGTSVTLTPVVKNCFIYELQPSDLTFYTGAGKTLTVLENAPFNVEVKDGAYVITAKPECSSSVKYSVVSKLGLYGVECSSNDGKPVSFGVKMGKAKISADKKEVTLLLRDRYSAESIKLMLGDGALSNIYKVELDKKAALLFETKTLGGGLYEIRWKENRVTTARPASITLNITLAGETEKTAATVKLKVKVI